MQPERSRLSTMSSSDPITAALPPNSDYITYLTILEYQLNAGNVSILTKHLVSDDGTLVREIGWDLVKLLLPLLGDAPKDAAQCLEVVARRGNPREVVVRVAEALETLSLEDDGEELALAAGEGLSSDPLRTFSGEAERIHLGPMKLEGMPSPPQRSGKVDMALEEESQKKAHRDALERTGKQFSSLLSMLGLLHARIKTQHPSRFLATTLPAALTAYRQIPTTLETTQAMLNVLSKLSGVKERPSLPPRSSTASVNRVPTLPLNGTEVYAPLPDPEGGSDENSRAPSETETSIVQRLLQAVSLEVLEEYLLAFPGTMEWSTRLYEKQAPQKLLPNRLPRLTAWREESSLRVQENLLDQFIRIAKNLRLDIDHAFRITNLPLTADAEECDSEGADEEENQEPSEYPTSPSQIPYPHLGSLFLFLASKVPQVLNSDQPAPLMSTPIPDLHHFVNQFVIPSPVPGINHAIPRVTHNPPSAIDGLLAFFFLTKFPPPWPRNESIAVRDAARPFSSPTEVSDYQSIIHMLSFLSADHPDPAFRTSANHIATQLLHSHPISRSRLAIIKSTLKDCGPYVNLKEVAISWLKEELVATTNPPLVDSSAMDREGSNVFCSPDLFSDDSGDNGNDELMSLIFLDPDQQQEDDKSLLNTIAPFKSHPPYQIAALNLLFLLLTNPILKARFYSSIISKMSVFVPSESDPAGGKAKQPHDDVPEQRVILPQVFFHRIRKDVEKQMTTGTGDGGYGNGPVAEKKAQSPSMANKEGKSGLTAQAVREEVAGSETAEPSKRESSAGAGTEPTEEDEKTDKVVRERNLAFLALAVGRVTGALEAIKREKVSGAEE